MSKPLVTFDLWETLIFDPPGKLEERRNYRMALFHQALHDLGHPVSMEKLSDAYRLGWERIYEVWENCGELTVPEQIADWLQFAGCKLELTAGVMKVLDPLYVKPFVDDPAGMIPGARATVAAAHDAGYTVGLISNTGRTPGWVLRDGMAGHGLLELFDFTMFSDEEVVRKPSPEIFHRAAERAGVERGIHIGDHPNYDITGGRSAGWTTIWVTSDGSDPEGDAADFVWPDIGSGARWFRKYPAGCVIDQEGAGG